MTAEPSPTELLDDLRGLRTRARADRRGYAFPLFLFGGLILLAPLLYVPLSLPPVDDFTFVPVDLGPFPQFVSGLLPPLAYPELVGWYWMLLVAGGLAGTAWWYRRRTRRLGLEGDTRLPIVAAGAGVLFWGSRPQRTDRRRVVGVFAGVLIASFAVAALLVLAWSERSAPLGVVGALFAGSALLVNLYDMPNLFLRR